MCHFDWALLLEYSKVLFSWPPIALMLGIYVIKRFRDPISNFINRAIEANVLGQQVKASPPEQQQLVAKPAEGNPIFKAAAEAVEPHEQAHATRDETPPADQNTNLSLPVELLPPDLSGDPRTAAALDYIKSNPIETLIEVKRVYFKLSCEKLFNRIFGTQIAILEYLLTKPTEEVTLQELAPFFSRHQSLGGIKNPEYHLRDYLNFLVSQNSVSIHGTPEDQRYKISQYGAEFLSYIKSEYPLNWADRAY